MATAIAYIRTSKASQTSSPAAQRLAIECWAAARGIVVLEWHEDLDTSSQSEVEDRPALRAALAAVELHGAAYLVAAAWDRFARLGSISDEIRAFVRSGGARLATSDGIEDFGDEDTVEPAAWLFGRLRTLFAEYEIRQTRWRTRSAMASRRAAGQRIGAIPWGMRLAADGKHAKRCAREGCCGCLNLEPNTDEMAVRTLAEQLRARGMSLDAIGKELSRRGFRSRRGAAWTRQRVDALLKSSRE